jgi:adenine-specific DNA-methyltransferase
MITNLEKLRNVLTELFQLDQADLDFGVYRILNRKRDEVLRFLDNDLMPQVKEAFSQYRSADKAVIEAEIAKAAEQAQALGVNPEETAKVKELRAKLASSGVDIAALENEVFSHLTSFFRRYYDEGDFISLRRYKEGVYAIPYEGEEVKLHWANADQYYVKSTETFRDYTFKTQSGKRVRVHLVAASTEQDNNKAAPGKERRFVLCEADPLVEENGELYIRFEYRPSEGKEKQDDLNQQAIGTILKTPGFDEWVQELARPAPTDKRKDRTVLEKHLAQYTARNTFDYFIHKDLGGFLRRELDFYIKNEVMHLDDIENESAPKVEQYLSLIKVIRKIAGKIIQFLEQLENFQKRLWLKKKFVIETNYCITLDRVPEELYPEIAANDAQREEWVRLFVIDEIKGDLAMPGYSKPMTVSFLKANDKLLLDTRFFDGYFKDRLLASIEGLDERCDGLLMHSENFQALKLIEKRLQGAAKVVYIDPPYNTNASAIPYKNNYRHSSWGTLMADRLKVLRNILQKDGAIFVSIDKNERTILEFAMDTAFGPENKVEELIWSQNTNDGRAPAYSTNHEYIEVYAKNRASVDADFDMFREPKPGYAEVMSMITSIEGEYPSLADAQETLGKLYDDHRRAYREEILAQDMDWEVEKRNDPWKGIYPYRFIEYRDGNGRYLPEDQARRDRLNAHLWVFRESDWTIMSSETKQSDTIKDPADKNYRYYEIPHPVTGKPCSPSSRGWKGTRYIDPDHPDRNSLESLVNDHRIVFGPDESKVPQQKRFLHEVESNVCKSVFVDYSDGEKETTAMFGRAGVFLAPKHTNFVSRFIQQGGKKDSLVVDCFGGSGSTGHAVIKLNRQDRGGRTYVLAEMAYYFLSVLKPRIMKAVYAAAWRDGKPLSHSTGVSHCFKYLRLESYEDALNNLELKRSAQQDSLLAGDSDVREQYLLSYMLDVESRGSQSLLNIDGFRNPDQYQLKVERNGETQLVNVDLVETFNWLLGLTVKHIDVIRGIRVIEGTNPEGDRVLVLWRNLDETDNDKLDQWFEKQGYSTRDLEYDLVYVNGDNNLENLRRPDQTWKVRLIEDEFQRLMFDVRDV